MAPAFLLQKLSTASHVASGRRQLRRETLCGCSGRAASRPSLSLRPILGGRPRIVFVRKVRRAVVSAAA
eukprot:scaffold222066_cov21-Prasinocladus_malaysianus.AAC.1